MTSTTTRVSSETSARASSHIPQDRRVAVRALREVRLESLLATDPADAIVDAERDRLTDPLPVGPSGRVISLNTLVMINS
jgi:hypothetical protein